MRTLLDNLEAVVILGTGFLSSVGAVIWRIEKLRTAFEDGVVRPVAAEESTRAVQAHVAEHHA